MSNKIRHVLQNGTSEISIAMSRMIRIGYTWGQLAAEKKYTASTRCSNLIMLLIRARDKSNSTPLLCLQTGFFSRVVGELLIDVFLSILNLLAPAGLSLLLLRPLSLTPFCDRGGRTALHASRHIKYHNIPRFKFKSLSMLIIHNLTRHGLPCLYIFSSKEESDVTGIHQGVQDTMLLYRVSCQSTRQGRQ